MCESVLILFEVVGLKHNPCTLRPRCGCFRAARWKWSMATEWFVLDKPVPHTNTPASASGCSSTSESREGCSVRIVRFRRRLFGFVEHCPWVLKSVQMPSCIRGHQVTAVLRDNASFIKESIRRARNKDDCRASRDKAPQMSAFRLWRIAFDARVWVNDVGWCVESNCNGHSRPSGFLSLCRTTEPSGGVMVMWEAVSDAAVLITKVHRSS